MDGGLVARRDLRAAGVDQRWLRRQVLAGRLLVVHPGVLATADLPMERSTDKPSDLPTRFRAALLQVGPDAALSHASALHAYGLLEKWDHDEIHVATPHSGVTKCNGLKIHKRPSGPVEFVDGLAVVSAKAALVGSAGLMDITELRFPAIQAVQNRLLTAKELADLTDVPLKARRTIRLIGEEALAGAESGGEANYYRLLLDAGLPKPQLQVWVQTADGFKRLDAYWEELAIGCEIDGDRFHGQKDARDRDRVRRNAIQATAVKLFDFSVAAVMRQPKRVVEDTEANLLARASELGVNPWWLGRSMSGKPPRSRKKDRKSRKTGGTGRTGGKSGHLTTGTAPDHPPQPAR